MLLKKALPLVHTVLPQSFEVGVTKPLFLKLTLDPEV